MSEGNQSCLTPLMLISTLTGREYEGKAQGLSHFACLEMRAWPLSFSFVRSLCAE